VPPSVGSSSFNTSAERSTKTYANSGRRVTEEPKYLHNKEYNMAQTGFNWLRKFL
jgi:hypothetical protein